MALQPGAKLGPYEILSLIGAGGMGEVYLARDPRLNREVAIKVLPADRVGDEDRRRRFVQEAHAASALNHPHIITIYEIESANGAEFIVMEYVRGKSLDALIPRHGMRLSELLRIAIPVADALATAHARGILHRDLKPANVAIGQDGAVKILDFGLAKLLYHDGAASGPEGGTRTVVAQTEPGRVVGTLAYMAPEQAAGGTTDARSDIFSFGAMLYEMATGQRAFAGKSAEETLERVLQATPTPPSRIVPTLPHDLERVILRCLRKDPARRFQTMADLKVDLQEIKETSDSGHSPLERNRSRVLRRTAVAAIVVVTIASSVWLLVSVVGVNRFVSHRPKITASTQITHDGTLKMTDPVTDGTRIYYSAASSIGEEFIAQVATTSGESSPLPPGLPHIIDISPNRTELLVSKALDNEAEVDLWARPVLGGAPRRLGDLRSAFSGAWSPDGQRIVYTIGSDVRLAASDGTGSRTLVTTAGQPFEPHWSPDGTRIRYSVADRGMVAASLWEASVAGGQPKELLPDWNGALYPCCGAWTIDGRYFVFVSGATGDLWALSEDAGYFRTRREPVQLTFGPLRFRGPVPSRDGKQLFAVGDQEKGEVLRFDIQLGRFEPYLSKTSATWLTFSRDGQWIAYVSYPEGSLWRSRVDGTERVQLTFPPLVVGSPQWSPDGTRLAFAGRTGSSTQQIYTLSAAGGTPKRWTTMDAHQIDPSWLPDGQHLLFGGNPGDVPPKPQALIHSLDLATGQITDVPGSQRLCCPRVAPDGSVVATALELNGLFRMKDSAGMWVEVYHGGVGYPSWSRDGRYVYFSSADKIRRVRIEDGHVEIVADTKGFVRASFNWFGLTPDDSPLVVRDVGSHEIYALDWDTP